MKKQEILTKAIEKAVTGGLTGYWANRYKKCVELDELEYLVGGNIYEEGHSLQDLIFNHDFAKALWGEREVSDKCKCGRSHKPHAVNSRGVVTLHGAEVINTGWRHHLQQMVIADDPIQYLGEHLDA